MELSPAATCGSTPWALFGCMRRLLDAYVSIVRLLGHQTWFAVFTKRIGCKLDQLLYQATGGGVGLTGAPRETMLLTTHGRKSGLERTVILFFVRDGANVAAACENFGLTTGSGWPKNLLADPQSRIQIGDTIGAYHARLATPEEMRCIVPKLAQQWPAHETYRRRTGQQYVFIFEPVLSRPAVAA